MIRINDMILLLLILMFIPFTLFTMIKPVNAGYVILSWAPSTTNADGTSLTDLTGYRVYYGTSPGTYGSVRDVGNITTYTVANLPENIPYYFAVTAYDTSGNESVYSNEVFKTIPQTTDATPPICPDVPNIGQSDTDGDGVGDACDPTPRHDLLLKRVTAPRVVNVRVARRPARALITVQVQNLLLPKEEGSHIDNVQVSLSLSGSLPEGCSMTLPRGNTQIGSVRPRRTKPFKFKAEFQCPAESPLGEFPITAETHVVHVPFTEQELNLNNNTGSRSFIVRIRK